MTAGVAWSISPMRDGRGARILVAGELDMATAPQLLDAVQAVVREGGAPGIVIDLFGVAFMDSSGLSALLRCQRAAGAAGCEFMLALPLPRPVERVIDISGVRPSFIFESSPPAAGPSQSPMPDESQHQS